MAKRSPPCLHFFPRIDCTKQRIARLRWRAASGPLHSWYDEAVKATWASEQDVRDHHANASICGNNRVVLNIGGNKYRLVVEVQYQAGIAWVKFVGTHAQYDRIDVENVNESKLIRSDDDLRTVFRRLESISRPRNKPRRRTSVMSW